MILIVEDEPLIAIDLEETLRARGYHTRIAATVEDATMQAGLPDIDLAIIDCLLRGKSSAEVARILRGRGIPFIVSSGADIEGEVDAFQGAPRLMKPFSDQDLERAVAATDRGPHQRVDGAF